MLTAHTDDKCAMCGKGVIRVDHERNEQQIPTTTIIVEQIDGSCYTFDRADCALMFKKFRSVYGRNFVENQLLS
jgi:hypothetical protein